MKTKYVFLSMILPVFLLTLSSEAKSKSPGRSKAAAWLQKGDHKPSKRKIAGKKSAKKADKKKNAAKAKKHKKKKHV